MDRKAQHLVIQKEAHLLFEKKNKDYGDAFANYGPIGVIVRMGDKIQRLISITKNGINLIKTESIRDTLIDLHNYSAMAIMLIDEEGKLKQNSINPKATDHWVKSYGMTDVIVGDAILIKQNALTDLW